MWKHKPDPKNPGQWQIVNATGKTVVFGLSERDASDFVARRNRQEEKRQRQRP